MTYECNVLLVPVSVFCGSSVGGTRKTPFSCGRIFLIIMRKRCVIFWFYAYLVMQDEVKYMLPIIQQKRFEEVLVKIHRQLYM